MAVQGRAGRARARRRRAARVVGLVRLGTVMALVLLGAVAAWHVFGGGGKTAPRATTAGGLDTSTPPVSSIAREFANAPAVTGTGPSTSASAWKLSAAALAAIPKTSAVTSAGPTAGKVVALTFDDGPSQYTEQVLAVLARYNVKATFFVVGREAKPREGVIRDIVAGGNAIGDHTWSHANLSELSPADRRVEVLGTQEEIVAAGRQAATLVRPPYGATTGPINALMRSFGLVPVLWNVDPQDYTQPPAGTIVERVVDAVQPGSIVLLHDGGGVRTNTVAALPEIIAMLRNRGWKMVTVPQLLSLAPPTAGDTVTHDP